MLPAFPASNEEKSELTQNSYPDENSKFDRQTDLFGEFEKAEEYTERYFDLSGISGKGSVSLIFLPGCDIDLKSIQFVY